jgi:peptidase C39-like protein
VFSSRGRTALAAGLTTATLVTAGTLPVLSPQAAEAASSTRHIVYRQWDSARQWRTGTTSGTSGSTGRLRLTHPTRTFTVAGKRYRAGSWTSGWVRPGFAATEVVPSWTASTPRSTLIQVEVRGIGLKGRRTSWDNLGRWARPDSTFRRTSLGSQRDDRAHVATDTWIANGGGFPAWQLRVTLLRRVGTSSSPKVGLVGAMASALPDARGVRTSKPGVARGRVLAVPRYSQMIHRGEYPRYGGGGEAWCSPTSTAMVLAYYRKLPPRSSYAWVKRSYTDRVVDHVARMTFDHGYDGTGNWPFNTGYAATRTGHACVTRFASLRGVERFIRAGIPVVTSITFGRGELDGAPISASGGHLVVVVGFTRSGRVVVNDPAARTRSGVRRTYGRGQFEDAWLERYRSGGGMRGSGGLAYIIRDKAHPLPARHDAHNW